MKGREKEMKSGDWVSWAVARAMMERKSKEATGRRQKESLIVRPARWGRSGGDKQIALYECESGEES